VLSTDRDLWQLRYGRDFRPAVDKWWGDQREHLVGWFRELDFPGYYNRARPRTAREAYGVVQVRPGSGVAGRGPVLGTRRGR